MPNVVLKNILVETCPACAMRYITIPKMAELHRTIALVLINKPGRLQGNEIMFLRKSLGLDRRTFSKKMHVRYEQINKWETRTNPVTISQAHDLALRMLVASGKHFEHYFENIERIKIKEVVVNWFTQIAFGEDKHWHPNDALTCC